MNYISLFSSAGVGCYGLIKSGYHCVATSELIERRLNVQKNNLEIKNEDAYILGDISKKENKSQLYSVVNEYLENNETENIDTIIFTPPCQGMSVANHKKNDGTIERNSLVVEALEIVEEIQPRFFIAENVRSFMNTKCINHDQEMKISEAFDEWLGDSYEYESKVINLKNYGANSSRTRTLVIGIRKDLSSYISVEELFPTKKESKTLKEVIGHLPSLSEMNEITENDIYHSFRPYRKDMRTWIKGLKEGESAFDNKDPLKRPHQIIDGKIKPNKRKNADKYTRQKWNKVGACIHTRNDILASQSTVHPVDDRVLSIRELMLLMNIPNDFKWTNYSLDELNSLEIEEKKKYLKVNAINIRQSIGEGIPTNIIEEIGNNIKKSVEQLIYEKVK